MLRNAGPWSAVWGVSLLLLGGCGSSNPKDDRDVPEASSPAAEATLQTVTLAQGTPMIVVLDSPLSTDTNQAGDTFAAHLGEPVRRDGEIVLPAGASVQGTIAAIDDGEKTSMTLDFPEIEANGLSRPLDVTPIELIAKPEGTKNAVKVLGGGAAGAILGAVVDGGQGAAVGGVVGMTAGTVAVLVQGEKVELPRGQRLSVRLESPAEVPARG